MIFPRYSLRTVLLITAVCAVISLVVAEGLRGRQWTAGLAMGLLAVAATLILGALAFALVWVFATILDGMKRSRATPDHHRSDPRAKSPGK